MPSVYIVDDLPCTRTALRDEVEKLWEKTSDDQKTESSICVDAKWTYIWDLLSSAKLKPGDIVLSDLFPVSYWKTVPKPLMYHPVEPLPDDPTNIYLAGLESVQRFLRQIPAMDVYLIVVTNVPRYIEDLLPASEAAEHLREVFQKEEFWGEKFWVYEKFDRTNDLKNFRAALSKVKELMVTQ